MLFERPAERRFLVGIDLRDDYCQISFTEKGRTTPKEPVTFTMVKGEEKFDIPMALCRVKEGGRWLAGPEALSHAGEEGAVYIPGILSLVREGSAVRIDSRDVDASALLAMYLKRCLDMMSATVPLGEIASIMFTSREMDKKMIGAIQTVRERLSLSCSVYCESYANSYYNYMLMQPQVLREPGVLLAEMQKGGRLYIEKLLFNQHTRPIVAYREEKIYPGIFGDTGREQDDAFLQILQKEMDGRIFASAYLLGSGFSRDWMKKSVSFLCRGRRVFMGNNLYSKGAAYGALLRTVHSEVQDRYYFLDSNKLRTNVGMRALIRGEAAYYPFLDAGVNWYEADKTADLILEDGNEIHLALKPLTGGEASDFLIRLEGLPVREGRIVRVRLHFTMTAQDKLHIDIEDLGFGEIFPKSGLKWVQEISV